jgi:dipeptidyl aminopeptidase/acylaminoacyl peptidase
MADEKITFEKNGLSFYGLFRQGSRAQTLPLIVLIHGGGATSAFFDNKVVRYVYLAATLDDIG